jgi:hypothetical protein
MKSKIKVSSDLTAPLCIDCGYELDFVQFHLECIKCKQTFLIKKRSGIEEFYGD